MKITARIKPNSRKGPLVETQSDGTYIVYVREPAIDGKANQALVVLLAKHFGVAKTNVSVVRGHTGRQKVIEVEGAE